MQKPDPHGRASAILFVMAAKRRKKKDRSIFDSIRKPVAPPSQRFESDKPEEKIHPSLRKTKHKKRIDSKNIDADL